MFQEIFQRNPFIQSEITSKPVELDRCGLHRSLGNSKGFNSVTNFFWNWLNHWRDIDQNVSEDFYFLDCSLKKLKLGASRLSYGYGGPCAPWTYKMNFFFLDLENKEKKNILLKERGREREKKWFLSEFSFITQIGPFQNRF